MRSEIPQAREADGIEANIVSTLSDILASHEYDSVPCVPLLKSSGEERARLDVDQFVNERQLQTRGLEALHRAWETLHSSGWTLEKESSHGDTVYSKLGSKGSKIYKLMGVVDIDSTWLFNEMVYNFENMSNWNKAITLGRIVQAIDNSTDVVYHVAAKGPGGAVSARDFVNVRHWKKIDETWVCAAISVVHKNEPLQKRFVR
nr:steroidogenic acute regulatory protein, mitochondrial-like [Cherax quadricarinatus]